MDQSRLSTMEGSEYHHHDRHSKHTLTRHDPKALWKSLLQRHRVQKNQKLIQLSSDTTSLPLMLVHFCFILLLYTIVVHTIPIDDLAKTYSGINAFLENQVSYPTLLDKSNTADLSSIATVDDTVGYTGALVEALLSDKSYHGKRQPDEHLMLLRVHRLINSIVLVQRRVEPSDCSYKAMRPLYKHCYEDLDDHELTEGKMELENGVEVPYDADLGGFAVELPLDEEYATEKFKELREGRFWDRATRSFSVMFALHNSPGHYTGNIELDFSISPFGNVKPMMYARFLRLKPYSEVVGGPFFLGLQLCGVSLWLLLLGHLLLRASRQPHLRWRVAMVFHPWTLMEIVSHILITTSIVLWIAFILNPRRTDIDFHSDRFQNLFVLGAEFHYLICCLSAVIILWTIRLIEFFVSFPDPNAQRTTKVVEAVIKNIGPFLLMVALVLTGFILAAHIFFGPSDVRFSTEWQAFGTLILWFVTLSSGQREMYNLPGGPFFLFFFIVFAMVILLNMFMAIVMAAYDEVSEEVNEPTLEQPWNYQLANKLCDFLGVEPYLHDPYSMPKLQQIFFTHVNMHGAYRRTFGEGDPLLPQSEPVRKGTEPARKGGAAAPAVTSSARGRAGTGQMASERGRAGTGQFGSTKMLK